MCCLTFHHSHSFLGLLQEHGTLLICQVWGGGGGGGGDGGGWGRGDGREQVCKGKLYIHVACPPFLCLGATVGNQPPLFIYSSL